MKIKLSLFLFVFVLPSTILTAQSSGYYFSASDHTITGNNNTLLMRNESLIWRAACSGQVIAYDNPAFDITFRVKMTVAGVKAHFTDSFPDHSNTSVYRMIMIENRSCDSIYQMSFNPYL
ncbi:MAG TPA: hypothetical protein VL651_02340, partial [Bacteroidia bacterium]|nr:hypothetical protein [Bacteroidia bacterium]